MTSDSKTQIGDDTALQDALEREAATREILQVISRSRDDEKPVFDVILENAARLCAAPMARLHLVNEARTHFELAASWGEELRSLKPGEAWPLDAPHVIPTSIREIRAIHEEDFADSPLYHDGDPLRVRLVDEEGIRTYLAVPLVNGDVAFGCIALSRREVKPFAEDEIALVEMFAAQAVIAIENVRQFRELQTRLEREAATREILTVISQSRADEKPVFDVILENASRLCNAPLAYLSMANEERTHVTVPAHRGARPAFAADLNNFFVPIDGSKLVSVRSITECTYPRSVALFLVVSYRGNPMSKIAMQATDGLDAIRVIVDMEDTEAFHRIGDWVWPAKCGPIRQWNALVLVVYEFANGRLGNPSLTFCRSPILDGVRWRFWA